MRSTNIAYLPQVDHLRALAAIWIILYHGEQLLGTVLSYGKTGFDPDNWSYSGNPFHAMIIEGHTAVALFMVLSGFIFTYGAFGRELRYKEFLLNRVLRIYPLYLCVLLFQLSIDSGYSLSSLVVTLLPISDLGWSNLPKPVAMSWAVAVEFQFYLLFPFLLVHFNRAPFKTVVSIIAVAFLFRVMGLALWKNSHDFSYWHLLGRIDQFMLGMAAAWAIRIVSPKACPIILALAAPLIVLSLYTFHRGGGMACKRELEDSLAYR